jgi:imidazolonepropionase-like amidohydrolase
MTSTIVSGVRVFDGENLLDGLYDVIFDGGIITSVTTAGGAAAGAPDVVDGHGGTLLPGLIDAHVHVLRPDDLAALAAHGVTTAYDMASWPAALTDSLRHVPGVTDILSAGVPGAGPGGVHSRIPGFPTEAILDDREKAEAFITARVAQGADYVKVVVEAPGRGGPDQATVSAVVEGAHAAGLRVIAHASALGAVAVANEAGVDILTHVPIDAPIDDAGAVAIRDAGRLVIPTLTMMEGVVANVARPGISYESARDSVSALHRAGVPIIAGTDANSSPGVPAAVSHGPSLHRELMLLVDAGLTPVEALRAATGLAARSFGLDDRGAVAVGKRADLVLVDGDPVSDIADSSRIRGIWIAGSPVQRA